MFQFGNSFFSYSKLFFLLPFLLLLLFYLLLLPSSYPTIYWAPKGYKV